MYAAGKIPGGFIKREGRPGEQAILAGRLTDRPIRPLFPKYYRNDVQIVNLVMSADQENDPSLLSIIGASAALHLSSIPFQEPVAAVKVGYIDDKLVVNPTMRQMHDESLLDLTVAGTKDAVLMVEAGVHELPEDLVLEAIMTGHRAMQPLIAAQEKLRKAAGQTQAGRRATRRRRGAQGEAHQATWQAPRKGHLQPRQGRTRGRHARAAQRGHARPGREGR